MQPQPPSCASSPALPELPELLDPPAAMLRVVDPETGRRQVVDLAAPRGREMFLRRAAELRAHTDEVLKRSRIDRIEITIPAVPDLAAIAQPILRFFRMRELREAKR